MFDFTLMSFFQEVCVVAIAYVTWTVMNALFGALRRP